MTEPLHHPPNSWDSLTVTAGHKAVADMKQALAPTMMGNVVLAAHCSAAHKIQHWTWVGPRPDRWKVTDAELTPVRTTPVMVGPTMQSKCNL